MTRGALELVLVKKSAIPPMESPRARRARSPHYCSPGRRSVAQLAVLWCEEQTPV